MLGKHLTLFKRYFLKFSVQYTRINCKIIINPRRFDNRVIHSGNLSTATNYIQNNYCYKQYII